MDIPNLASPNLNEATPKITLKPKIPKSIIAIVVVLGLTSGFWLSRLVPLASSSDKALIESSKNDAVSTDQISGSEQLDPGVVYGNSSAIFSDSAQGVVIAGDINGVGTHILVREGGDSQRVSLTSSTVDLDLFIDKKVLVKGQTNDSQKTGWLLDVGNIKIIQ
jgi:hypothetical protein